MDPRNLTVSEVDSLGREGAAFWRAAICWEDRVSASGGLLMTSRLVVFCRVPVYCTGARDGDSQQTGSLLSSLASCTETR